MRKKGKFVLVKLMSTSNVRVILIHVCSNTQRISSIKFVRCTNITVDVFKNESRYNTRDTSLSEETCVAKIAVYEIEV